jgi:hypothetical protein
MFITFNCVQAYIGLAKIYHFRINLFITTTTTTTTTTMRRSCYRLHKMNYFRYPFLFPFPFDFCCFRAVTARPITTFFKSALQFFILINHIFYILAYCQCSR